MKKEVEELLAGSTAQQALVSPSFHYGKAMEPTQLIGGLVKTLQLDQAIRMREIERLRTPFQRARRNTGCTLSSPLNLLNTRIWLASKGRWLVVIPV